MIVDLRADICKWARWGVDHTADIHYREFRPMDLSLPKLPWTGDCSTAVREWYKLAGAPDPMGLGYADLSGNTQTLMGSGQQIVLADCGPADMVIYGTDDLSTQHVSLILESGTNPLTVSHGDEAGPLLQHVFDDPRPKRYFRFTTSIVVPDTPEEDVLLIVINPNNNGQAVLNLADGTYFGFPNPDMLQFYKDNGVKVATRQPTKAEWGHFVQKGTV